MGARRDRQGAGGDPRAGPRRSRRRRRSAARRRRTADPADASWVRANLLALIGLGTESELGDDRSGQAFAAWRRFFESMAERRPLVLVFEDLHWADETLLDFVDELVDWVNDVPLLVVATRAARAPRAPTRLGGGKLNATTLAVAPLRTTRRRASSPGSSIGPSLRGRAAGAPRTSGRQSALRGAVLGTVPRARLDRGASAARDAPGHHCRPPRRPRAGREGPAPQTPP